MQHWSSQHNTSPCTGFLCNSSLIGSAYLGCRDDGELDEVVRGFFWGGGGGGGGGFWSVVLKGPTTNASDFISSYRYHTVLYIDEIIYHI